MTKAKNRSKKPRTALEGIGWTRVEEKGEIMLRCHRCEGLVPVMAWWQHGSTQPCDPASQRDIGGLHVAR